MKVAKMSETDLKELREIARGDNGGLIAHLLCCYETMFDNACDENADTLEFKPEIKAAIGNKNHFGTMLRIIEGGMRGDIKKVENYAHLLADKVEADGYIETAFRIRKIANGEAKQIAFTLPKTNTLDADGHLNGEE